MEDLNRQVMEKVEATVINPYVSVIVPVYNDKARIGLCIEALLNQTYTEDLYEVLVVDNGSDDGTVEVIQNYPVKLLIEDVKRNSYAARNRGIANARGEVIAFTDADCIPRSDWIEKGVARLEASPGCGLIGGKIVFFYQRPNRPSAVEIYDSILGLRQKEHIENGKYGATANVFTFKKVIDDVGLFDDALKSGGDNEWGRRVHASGYGVLYADDAVVAHPARHSYGELYRRLTRLTGGNFSQRKNNMEFIKLWMSGTKNAVSVVARTVLGMRPAHSLNGTTEKAKFISMIAFAEAVRNYERIRLLLGGAPRR